MKKHIKNDDDAEIFSNWKGNAKDIYNGLQE